MPTIPPASENEYFIDAENAAEMARLMHQDRLTTRGMGGVFPERSDFSTLHDILDIACGPGGWVLDVAFEHPTINVMGIDISGIMIEYARAQAWTQGLNTASFRVMDALKPLDFADGAFALDLSAGTGAHGSMYQNSMAFFRLIEPFLLSMQETTKGEFEELYNRMLAEVLSDSFRAVSFILTVWGETPGRN